MIKNPGTYDYYFDMADQLEEMGVEFSLTVKHVGGEALLVVSNVQREDVARGMVAGLVKSFKERFNPSPDGDHEV